MTNVLINQLIILSNHAYIFIAHKITQLPISHKIQIPAQIFILMFDEFFTQSAKS